MTIGLGLAGFRLCFDAVEFYQFYAAWNSISRRNRVDTDVVNYSKKSIMERNIQIENSLDTTTFANFIVQQQQQMKESNNDNNNNSKKKQQQRQQQSMDTTPSLLSQTKVAAALLTTTTTPTTITTTCTICLGDFQANERISSSKHSTYCKHIFHTACLHAWLFKHTSCPVCRYGMVPAPAIPPQVPTSLLLEPASSVSPTSIFSINEQQTINMF